MNQSSLLSLIHMASLNNFKSKILPKKCAPQCLFFKLNFVLHHYLRASQINILIKPSLGIDLDCLITDSFERSTSFHQKARDRLHAYSQRPNLRKSRKTRRQRRGPRIGNHDTNSIIGIILAIGTIGCRRH